MHDHLKKWLEKCGMNNIQPVNVCIKGIVMVGARYQNPHLANRTMIYVIGDHPEIYKRNGKEYARGNVCYRLPNDERDWYIASYFHAGLLKTYFKKEAGDYQHCHPFGMNFLLAPWDLEEEIDKYDRFKCKRKDVLIESV